MFLGLGVDEIDHRHDEPDPKQKMIDHVMEILEAQHNRVEAERIKK